MKLNRHLAGLLTTLASCSAFAGTLLSEGFDNISTLPAAGWVQTNNSSPSGSTSWFQGNPAVFAAASGAANSYIAANFNNASYGGNISNWLMSPTLTFSGQGTLNFALRLLGDGWMDTVEVYFSANGTSTSINDFGLLDTFSSDVDTDWVQEVVNIGSTGANSGRFAFRYVVSNTDVAGNYIGIDTVTVTSVTEPASLVLVALGLGVLGMIRRKQGPNLTRAV